MASVKFLKRGTGTPPILNELQEAQSGDYLEIVHGGTGSNYANLDALLQGLGIKPGADVATLTLGKLTSGQVPVPTASFPGGVKGSTDLSVSGVDHELKVTGIQNSAVPSLPGTAKYLKWSGAAWEFADGTAGTGDGSVNPRTGTNNLGGVAFFSADSGEQIDKFVPAGQTTIPTGSILVGTGLTPAGAGESPIVDLALPGSNGRGLALTVDPSSNKRLRYTTPYPQRVFTHHWGVSATPGDIGLSVHGTWRHPVTQGWTTSYNSATLGNFVQYQGTGTGSDEPDSAGIGWPLWNLLTFGDTPFLSVRFMVDGSFTNNRIWIGLGNTNLSNFSVPSSGHHVAAINFSTSAWGDSFFHAITSNGAGSYEETEISTVAVNDTTEYTLLIRLNGATWQFFLNDNDTPVAQHSSNVPGSTISCAPIAMNKTTVDANTVEFRLKTLEMIHD
jgi:hypothetical protein